MSKSASTPSRREQTDPIKIKRRALKRPDQRETASLPHSNNQSSTRDDYKFKWQDILWREWHNCEDKDYAYHLYESAVRHSEPWLGVIFLIVLGLGRAKLYGYDPSGFVPISIGIVFGLIVALVSGAIFGLAPGLVLGVFAGSVGFWSLMLALTLLPLWREKVAVAFDRLCKWEEPSMAQVEMALREAVAVKQSARWTWAEPLHHLERQKQEPDSLDTLLMNLQADDWMARFVARYGLVSLGGVAIEPLQAMAESRTIPLNRLAVRLLKNIEIETASRWAKKAPSLLCPHCLARCQVHSTPLSWQPDLTFYGCRICHQSREFLEEINQVVAVLDTAWTEVQLQRNDTLYINWLVRRALFDFDRVEIIQATDEEVERFAVQVGNDTDPVRQPCYTQMSCHIARECHLSENTLRILERTFGLVEQMETVG